MCVVYIIPPSVLHQKHICLFFFFFVAIQKYLPPPDFLYAYLSRYMVSDARTNRNTGKGEHEERQKKNQKKTQILNDHFVLLKEKTFAQSPMWKKK